MQRKSESKSRIDKNILRLELVSKKQLRPGPDYALRSWFLVSISVLPRSVGNRAYWLSTPITQSKPNWLQVALLLELKVKYDFFKSNIFTNYYID